MRSWQMLIDVAVDIEPSPLSIGTTVFLPEQSPPPDCPALFCFPGGGMGRHYFDLDGNSFAHALTSSGAIVVTFDYPGIGDSSAPADGFLLTGSRLAAIGAEAAGKIADLLRNGRLLAESGPIPALRMIGVGHSMGAMVVCLQQANHQPYAALALLGFSTRGLPEVLTSAEQAAATQAVRDDDYYAVMARQRFGQAWRVDIPQRQAGSAALKSAAAPLLTVAAMQSMLPGNIAAEAAMIDVPLFLAVGDRDITGKPDAIAPRFSAARDVTLLLLDETGHHPFVSVSSGHLYAGLAAWIRKK